MQYFYDWINHTEIMEKKNIYIYIYIYKFLQTVKYNIINKLKSERNSQCGNLIPSHPDSTYMNGQPINDPITWSGYFKSPLIFSAKI